jgi:hypothetical protein
MKKLLLLALCGTLAGLAVKINGELSSHRAEDPEWDWWNLPRSLRMLTEEELRQAELEELGANALQGIARREEVACQLVDGRLTLGQAASRLREIEDATLPANRKALDRADPDDSDPLRYHRQALRLVQTYLYNRSTEPPGLLNRLEAELEQALSAEPLSSASLPCS